MKRIHGIDIRTSLGELCDPQHMALLVYDMQVGIVSQIKQGREITKRAGRVLAVARRKGLRVAFTRHLSLPKAWMGMTQYRTAMAWQRSSEPDAVSPWFLREAPGFQIVPELAPQPDEAVFDKLAMSAFEGTPLATALHDCGIKAVAIIGIATEIGIEPTTRHATDLGFVPVVIADACGAGHEDAGARALEMMRFMGEAMITTVEEVTGLLERQAGVS